MKAKEKERALKKIQIAIDKLIDIIELTAYRLKRERPEVSEEKTGPQILDSSHIVQKGLSTVVNPEGGEKGFNPFLPMGPKPGQPQETANDVGKRG